MSGILGTLGNVAKGVATYALAPELPGASLIGSHIDPTPGFSATQMVNGTAYAPSNPYPTGNLATWGTGAAQPTGNDVNNTGTSGSNGTYYSSGSGYANYAQPAIDYAALAQYDQQIGNVQNGINRLDNQQNVGLQNVQSGYNDALNTLVQGKANAQNQYNQGTTQNTQNYVSNKNTIGQNAGNSLNGLQRLLGAHGAGGSSAALFNAPQAVALQATQQRAGAGQTFGANQQGLDTNWNTFLQGEGQDEKKLGDQLTNNQNSLKAQIDSNRANLLSSLATLQGQRAAAAGGNAVGAAQPYIDQANSYLSQADNLGQNVPVYQQTPTTYTAPTIQSYTANPFAAAQANNQDAATQSISPYLSLLLGAQKDKQNPLQVQPSL